MGSMCAVHDATHHLRINQAAEVTSGLTSLSLGFTFPALTRRDKCFFISSTLGSVLIKVVIVILI